MMGPGLHHRSLVDVLGWAAGEAASRRVTAWRENKQRWVGLVWKWAGFLVCKDLDRSAPGCGACNPGCEKCKDIVALTHARDPQQMPSR